MKTQRAMLMAAGLGTRLRPFTDQLPKPLLPVLGVPMAQFAVDSARKAGVSHIVANIHHLPEIAISGLKSLDLGLMHLDLSDERDLLLGSAGGLKKAQPYFKGESIFLLNGDVLSDVDLELLDEKHQELKEKFGVTITLSLLAHGPKGAKYREIYTDPSTGLITATGDVVEGRPFFTGAAVIEAEALREVPLGEPSDFLTRILHTAIAQKKAGFLAVNECRWYDIGSADLWLKTQLQLNQEFRLQQLPESWNHRIELGLSNSKERVHIENGSIWYGPRPADAQDPGVGLNGIWTMCRL